MWEVIGPEDSVVEQGEEKGKAKTIIDKSTYVSFDGVETAKLLVILILYPLKSTVKRQAYCNVSLHIVQQSKRTETHNGLKA